MTPAQAVEEARSGNLRPVYLVVGEEVRLQADVLKALKEAATRGGVPGLNEDQFNANETGVEPVLGAARTLPMMSSRRHVLVRGVERWEPSQGQAATKLDTLAEYAESPCPSTTLVLSATKLDNRRRLIARAKSGGWLVLCEPMSRQALPRWLEDEARQRGSRLEPGVAALLAELCGPELAPCADALERVCLFAGPGVAVTEEHVSSSVVRLRTSTVWELVAAVGSRDLATALRTLEEVYDPHDRGLRLVGLLAWSARQLIKFEAAMRAGCAPPEAATRAGAPPFKARELAEQLKRISRPILERWLTALAAVDADLKGGSKRPPKAVLEYAIIELCQGGRGDGPSQQTRAP